MTGESTDAEVRGRELACRVALMVVDEGPSGSFLGGLLALLVERSRATGGHLYSVERDLCTILPADARLLSVPEDARDAWRAELDGRRLLVAADGTTGAPARDLLDAHGAQRALILPLSVDGTACAFFALYDPAEPTLPGLDEALSIAGRALAGLRRAASEVPWPELVALVHTFAHDFRNDLSVVINQAELITEEVGSDALDLTMTLESLRDVLLAAHAAQRRVNDLAEHFPK